MPEVILDSYKAEARRCCPRCKTTMYRSDSTGQYSCRNFDCPPGTEAKYKASWKLREQLTPLLKRQPVTSRDYTLTVEEINTILNDKCADIDHGERLLAIARRIGHLNPFGLHTEKEVRCPK